MKIHTLPFINFKWCPLLDYIKDGIKTVEGRIYSPQYQQIKKDDIIIFKTKNETVYVKVVYVNKYKSLEEYLEKETLEKTVPCIKTFNDAINLYNQWSSPVKRQQLNDSYGFCFLGIGISVITKEQFQNATKYKEYKKKYHELKNN